MVYTLRQRNQNSASEYSNDPESDHTHGFDPDYSSSRPRRATKRRSTASSTSRVIETETMDLNSRVDLIANHRRRRRSRPSKKTSEGEQSKEMSEVGQSSCMNRGSFSPEGQITSKKRGSPSPDVTSSSKKTILSWLIDCNLIEEYEQVCYMDETKVSAAMTGRITRGGIRCNCCQKEISVWTFEEHAGSDLRQPYEHIYLLKKATCLGNFQVAAWHEAKERKRRETFYFVPKGTAADKNDDACSICGDGGDLICCEKCPSTHHAYCLNMERVPQCDWFCPYCICKHCGLGGDNKQLVTCSQCEKKFHWRCFKEFSKESIDVDCSRLYCGPSCKQIYEKLESSLGAKTDIYEDYSWRVIHPTDMTPKVLSATRNQHLENNSKVAVASILMNESFETITDRHTGINFVESVVYSRGSNLTRINFSRFYTFILEKDDAIICAASIRIHGRRFAEMPLIATEETHRGQGICGMLLTVIETFLSDLEVQNLIIPSAAEISEMWKQKYGFNELTEELKREAASYNILMFPHALRLYKNLRTRRAIAAPAPDGGEGNEDKEAENQNGQEPQKDQAKGPLPDLNLDPPDEDQ